MRLWLAARAFWRVLTCGDELYEIAAVTREVGNGLLKDGSMKGYQAVVEVKPSKELTEELQKWAGWQ